MGGKEDWATPLEPTGLVGDLQQKLAPETGALQCFRLFAKLPGDLPTRFANALLSRGAAVIIPWRAKRTGFAHRLLSQDSVVVNSSGERSTAFRSLHFLR